MEPFLCAFEFRLQVLVALWGPRERVAYSGSHQLERLIKGKRSIYARTVSRSSEGNEIAADVCLEDTVCLPKEAGAALS
jgi:uncharacterized protein (DUF39 family)